MSYNSSISGSNLKKLLISATNLLLSYPYSFCIWSIEQSHFLYHKYENSQSQNPEVKVDSINMPHVYALSLSHPRILLHSIHQALPKNREMHIKFYFREHHPIATCTSWYLSIIRLSLNCIMQTSIPYSTIANTQQITQSESFSVSPVFYKAMLNYSTTILMALNTFL